MRLIRLVVAASSSVLSGDDETKMNWKKHESSLLEVFSDVGSTPTASTILLLTPGDCFTADVSAHLARGEGTSPCEPSNWPKRQCD